MSRTVSVNRPVREANQKAADAVRETLLGRGIWSLNVLSGPGSGKTTLIEETIRRMAGRHRIGAIAGDIQTDQDARRIAAAGAVQAEQIETRGACHLIAENVQNCLQRFRLEQLDILIIENVGNLVCPIGWDLGEHNRIVLLSVPEGDDKPSKYPSCCLQTDALLITKIDALPLFRFDADRAEADARKLHPGLDIFRLSATTGEGMQAWIDWIDARVREFLERTGARSQGNSPAA